jgi:N-methylhydantoinase B
MIDPIRFEIIRQAIDAAAQEMCVALYKSAYSTNIKTRLDLSCAILDRNGRVIGQSAAMPCHISAMNVAVPASLRVYGQDKLEPGDQIATNDPYQGATHLNDIIVIAPLFLRDKLIGYAANLAHHVDVGGARAGSLAPSTEIYQEGLILPIVKIARRGRLETDVYRMFMANVRAKKETAGDFRAQIAANVTAERRITELLERFDLADLDEYVEALFTYTAERTHNALERLPAGEYEAEEFEDDDGITDRPIRFQVKIKIGGGRVHFDFSGSDPQRPSSMNATFTQTFAACAYVTRCLIDRDVPDNDGFFRFIEVHAPPGLAVNAERSAGVAGGWEISLRLCDMLFRAFSKALPESVPAGCKAMVCHAVFGGRIPGTNEDYVFIETLAGGHGGRKGSDGPDVVQTHHQNSQNTPIEEMEVFYPVRTLRYELIADSEGAGQYRGGLGVLREYTFPEHTPTFTILADRRRFPPRGLFGGEDGRPARYTLVRHDGRTEDLPSKCTFIVPKGGSVRYETCGGGGYGKPWERDPRLVQRDVSEGKVSIDRAAQVYRVAIAPVTGVVDIEATRALRAEKSGRVLAEVKGCSNCGG